MTDHPLLSICIPTYNRADLLRSALWALAPQIQAAGDQVEVIVSDNCSPDHTPEVVKWAQQFMPVRYHRNSENIGAVRNTLHLTNCLANGEYGWILGDDDLVRENGVESVLQCLQSNPEIDCLFLNHSYEDVATRHKPLVTGADYPELRNLLCWKTDSLVVQRWEEVIGFSATPALFTSIVSHVFRLSMWKSVHLEIHSGEPFDSLENTFPHASIIARGMVGRPAVYVGYPHVILFVGAQEWFHDYWPVIMFVRVLELSDLLEELGADIRLVDQYRNLVFKSPQGPQMFFRLLNEDLPGREYFSLTKFILRYGKFHYARVLMSRYAEYTLVHKVLSPAKQSLLRALSTNPGRSI